MEPKLDKASLKNLLDYAVFYSNDAYLWKLIIFRIVTAILGVLLIIVLKIHRKKFFAHPNLTSLMHWHSFWTFLMSILVVIDHLIAVKEYLFEPPSNMIHSNLNCFLRRWPILVALYGTVSSMFAISIERYYASKHFRTYEMTHERLGVLLVVLHIAIMVLISAAVAATYEYPLGVTAYCGLVTSPIADVTFKGLSAILFWMEIFTIVVCTKLRNENERRLQMENAFNLSERYQIAENVRMLRLLLPVVWSHIMITIFGILAFISYTLLQMHPIYDPIYEDSIQFVHLQSVFMPICFYIQYRRSLHRQARIMSTNKGTGDAYVVRYTESIQRGW